jgi:hypothetical protein
MDDIEKLKAKKEAQLETKMNYSLNDIIDDSIKMDDDAIGNSLTTTNNIKTTEDFYSIETLIHMLEIYLKLRNMLYANIKFNLDPI